MNINLFEGFKRFNRVFLLIILLLGIVLSFKQNSYTSIEEKLVLVEDTDQEGSNNEQVSTTCSQHVGNNIKTDYGTAFYTICFKDSIEYKDALIVAQNFKLPEETKVKYESAIFYAWLIDLAKGIGATLIAMVLYLCICAAIKYVATGFISKNQT